MLDVLTRQVTFRHRYAKSHVKAHIQEGEYHVMIEVETGVMTSISQRRPRTTGSHKK